jgi:putative addiction module component (TIGR02574 family)
MTQQDTIREKALAMNPVERAVLIEELLGSFDKESRNDIDAAWAAEAEDRINAFDQGKMGAIGLEESRKRINIK